MIKNDKWIKEMAGKGMIQPFVPELVRKVDGRAVISFGLSSFGADLRLSPNDFRIFRHIPGTVVDPKNFNPENLESAKLHTDANGSYFILPAHSYGLGVTVERLQIPPNITCLFVGKCLTADTRILNPVTGAWEPISDFSGESIASSFWYEGTRTSVAAECMQVISQGLKPVCRLTTTKGLTIKGTSEHPIMTKTGWKFLGDLTSDDYVATPASLPFFGQGNMTRDEAVLLALMIANGQCNTPGGSPTFTSKDPVLVAEVASVARSVLSQEISFNGDCGYRLVNKIGRGSSKGGVITKNRATEWLQKYKLNVGSTQKFVPASIFTAKKEVVAVFLQALFSCDGCITSSSYPENPETRYVHLSYSTSSRQLIEDVYHLLLRFGILGSIRVKHPKIGNTGYELTVCASSFVKKFLAEIGFTPGSKKDLLVKEKIGAILAKTKSRDVAPDGVFWQKVKGVQDCGEEEVFDIEVPHFRNFIANNFVVHNSTYARVGCIWNLTPGEAAWEGYLTLEVSNSSDTDCRIYANEGVVQALFLEGEPCATTYHDRAGKYQDQPESVTLARV